MNDTGLVFVFCFFVQDEVYILYHTNEHALLQLLLLLNMSRGNSLSDELETCSVLGEKRACLGRPQSQKVTFGNSCYVILLLLCVLYTRYLVPR